MPRVTISEHDTDANGADLFPKLELDNEGEKARLFIPLDDAWAEWVHTIRAPVFEGGEPSIEKADRKGGRDRYETYFIGQRICLGDPEVMQETRSDPRNCPACAAAERGVVEQLAADRRYSIPVIRYACKTKTSTEVRTGGAVGGEILVWALTSRMYRSLAGVVGQMRDLLELPEPAEIHLRFADVVVERESGGPQRLKFLPPARSAAAKDESVRAYIRALWGDRDNRPTDEQLRARCGRDPDRVYMVQDVQQAEREWAKVRRFEGGGAAADPLAGGEPGQDRAAGGGKGLQAEMDALLDEDAAAAAEPAAGSADPLADHPGGLGEFAPRGGKTAANGAAAESADPLAEDGAAAESADPLAEAPAAKAKAPAAAGAKGGKPTKSFDDILGDVGDD